MFGEEFSLELPAFVPRYNIAPTQNILAVRRQSGGCFELVEAHWGFVPAWENHVSKGPPIINARSETINSKPTFREAFKNSRCVILADGYYEWQSVGKSGKQPFWIHRDEEKPFLFGGLLTANKQATSQTFYSAAILTKPSFGELAILHDRMPLIFDQSAPIHRWLDDAIISTDALSEFCATSLTMPLRLRPVSKRVGKVTSDDPSCLDPIPIFRQRTLDI
jgi:putative SOS response-associated peptidase YedK